MSTPKKSVCICVKKTTPPGIGVGAWGTVATPAGRVRYPDVKVACGAFDPGADHVEPVVVFEVRVCGCGLPAAG